MSKLTIIVAPDPRLKQRAEAVARVDAGVRRLMDEMLETMHASYAKTCLPAMEARLREGRFKIIGFFPDVRVVEIPEADVARHRAPDVLFMNVNTPDELARARVLAAELG